MFLWSHFFEEFGLVHACERDAKDLIGSSSSILFFLRRDGSCGLLGCALCYGIFGMIIILKSFRGVGRDPCDLWCLMRFVFLWGLAF